MNDDAVARVDRLKVWLRIHRRDLCDEAGNPVPGKLAQATGRKPAYWSDVLRGSKSSFAAAAARAVEDKLTIPHLYLEGASWPFEDVDQERFNRLRPVQKGRVEQALIDILDRIEAEQSGKRMANGS